MVYKGRQHRQETSGHRVQYLIFRGNRLAAQMEQLTNQLIAARNAARQFQNGRSLFLMSDNEREQLRILTHNIFNIQADLDRLRDIIEDNEDAIQDAFDYFNLTVQEQDHDPQWEDEN